MSTPPTVAVVGTGAVGAMTLWQLATRGVTAIGFDTYAPGHDRGGYGGQTRIFRIAYREGSEYVPMLQRSLQLWRDLEAETRTCLLTLCGGLTIAPEDHPDLAMVRECARDFDLPHEDLSAHDAALRYPQLPVESHERVLLDHSAGVLRPEPAVMTAARRAEELGAVLHRYSPVSAIEQVGDKTLLRAGDQEHLVDHVVLAPGPWAPERPELQSLPLEVHQITTMWFPTRRPGTFAVERTPIVIRSGPIGFSCFPAVDGELVKVSLHSLPRPHVDTAEHITRNPSAQLLDAVREAVTRFLPDVHPDPVRIGTYADCFTRDGHAVVGPLPGQPRTTVLTGFSGHGFKMAPVLGEIAADLALTGSTSHDIAHLSPTRFDLTSPEAP